ncbi:recombinase family protein [Paludisphaera mucosa]|uniref:Recombinase family protein n=1 Tax=Paludisphaera mucosa TaxID=3030827 RepID=A0ABT6FE92_9BACT|nr:recombinase family protein [Paludisphaera mucosa]MDG3005898.1 recombinase family protein [Paludisphaera mucosa]
MSGRLDPPLAPRSGQVLRVLMVCRISTEQQDVKSLADQEAMLRDHLAAAYEGRVDVKVIASRGSGQHLDRVELLEIERLIEGRGFDLVVAEDLARICRRAHAYEICELAQDHGARLIAVNDFVDTARDDWHLGAFFNVFRHEASCRDTSRRIRRSLRNRFAQGGVVQTLVYGYIKPPGAASDADVVKAPEAEAIYDEWFRLLEGGATYAEVADWLNGLGVRPGPACRSATWNIARVRGATLNPILKGERVRNRMIAKRTNKTGRSHNVPAPPEDLLVRHVPHLAFIDPDRYDRVVALIKRRTAKYKAKGLDARKGVSRKRTAFPGQHLTCGICGRLCYYGGHGRADHLICSGARDHRCWNGATVGAGLAARMIARAVLAGVEGMCDFDAALRSELEREVELVEAEQGRTAAGLRRDAAEAARQVDNVVAAMTAAGPSAALVEKLHELEAERERLDFELAELARTPAEPLVLPTKERLRALAGEAFEGLLTDSQEAARLARRLLPRLEVIPYRLCDGEAVEPRAHLTVDLTALVPGTGALEGRLAPLKLELVVDLFEPPQRVAFRERVVELRASGSSEKKVAAQLGLTVTATQRAASLDRLMDEKGLADPYVRMTGPLEDSKRTRRHRHPRYRFEPLAGWSPSDVDGPRAA